MENDLEFTLRADQVGKMFDGLEFETASNLFTAVLCTCIAEVPKEDRLTILNHIMKNVLKTLEAYDEDENDTKIPKS